jgi:hypothetical protein
MPNILINSFNTFFKKKAAMKVLSFYYVASIR